MPAPRLQWPPHCTCSGLAGASMACALCRPTLSLSSRLGVTWAMTVEPLCLVPSTAARWNAPPASPPPPLKRLATAHYPLGRKGCILVGRMRMSGERRRAPGNPQPIFEPRNGTAAAPTRRSTATPVFMFYFLFIFYRNRFSIPTC